MTSFTYEINQSTKEGYYPESIINKSLLIQIYKRNDCTDLNSCRPISLISQLSKILNFEGVLFGFVNDNVYVAVDDHWFVVKEKPVKVSKILRNG